MSHRWGFQFLSFLIFTFSLIIYSLNSNELIKYKKIFKLTTPTTPLQMPDILKLNKIHNKRMEENLV